MTVLTLGFNHQTANIALREQVVFSQEQAMTALTELVQFPNAEEALLLSTCNRTEFYAISQEPVQLREWLLNKYFSQVDAQKHLYCYQGRQAVSHIFRVANGLDSMMLGEPQILGQLKQAFSQAEQCGAVGTHLRRLFQYSFSVAKSIRSQTALSRHPVSVAFAAVHLAKKIYTDLKPLKVMLIGSGQTIELTAYYLADQGVYHLNFVGRGAKKTERLAERFQGSALGFSALLSQLPQMDVVISATTSPLPILGVGSITQAVKTRKYRPLLLLDLAVPRDIEPQVAELDDVLLYNIDDLQSLVTQNLQQRKVAAKEAEAMIEAHVEYYLRRLNALDVVSTIQAFRRQVADHSEKSIQKALHYHHKGHTVEQSLKYCAHLLANKLMHVPCEQMQQAGFQGQLEVLQYMRHLFDLDEKEVQI